MVALDPDIAFCAGFFEADGCCSVRKTTATLSFYNDNKQVLEKIRDVLSVDNNILSREKPRGGTSYTLTIGKREDVTRIAEQFLSCGLVTVKQERLLEAREIVSKTRNPLKNTWTEEEDRIIKVAGKTINELTHRLRNRTPNSIRTRRSGLGVNPRPHWSEDEENIIRNTLDKTAKEVAEILDKRTAEAISKKRRYIGLKPIRSRHHKLARAERIPY